MYSKVFFIKGGYSMTKTDDLLAEILDELKKMNSKIESLEEKFGNMMPKIDFNPMDLFKNLMKPESDE